MWYIFSNNLFDDQASFGIKNFEDRNLINHQIRSLKKLNNLLRYCSKLVFQTQRGARRVVEQIRMSKKVSSFPSVIAILEEADKVALDSPYKFEILCQQAAIELDKKISKLIQTREDFARSHNKKN